MTSECPFQAHLLVSLLRDGFRGAGSHLGDLIEVCGLVAINDGTVGSEIDGLVRGVCSLRFLGSFEFRLQRREALLPCVRDVRWDASVSMGTDGLHHFLESGSRDGVCFSKSLAGTRVMDPAKDVLLGVEEDAGADALGIRCRNVRGVPAVGLTRSPLRW